MSKLKKKRPSMSQMKRIATQLGESDWHFCNPCQIKRGGKIPKDGHLGITVMCGTCRLCGLTKQTLVPNDDYIWPGQKFYLGD